MFVVIVFNYNAKKAQCNSKGPFFVFILLTQQRKQTDQESCGRYDSGDGERPHWYDPKTQEFHT
jgi:hypothetical protein